jgi:methylase of polypeptide subunit release factors
MTNAAPETAFHRRLYVRLSDYLNTTPDAPFSAVSVEEKAARGRADLSLESQEVGGAVIAVTRVDVNPRSTAVVRQARSHADAVGAAVVATCNANDFFLVDDRDESAVGGADVYYVNLRTQSLEEAVPEILNAVVHLCRDDCLPPQHERERLVGVLRSFHSSVWPTLQYLARRASERDEQFSQLLDAWVEENGYAGVPDDDQLALAAKQYAFLLTYRVLFSEVVRERTSEPTGTASGFQGGSSVEEPSVDDLEAHLSHTFETLVSEVASEPILTPDTGLFGAFPHSPKTRRATAALIEHLGHRSVTEVDEDLLGELYEEVLPVAERNALGQYYTHPKLAETIVQWAIPDPDDHESHSAGETAPRVLDPAAGSGTFTVEAYQRLSDCYPTLTHQELVDHLVAVDINRFPLHLTSLNLASRTVEEATDRIHAYHTSFFDLDPQTAPRRSSRRSDADSAVEQLGTFDAVVGNPPYIRQENLHPTKEHFRAHLETFGRDDRTPYYDGHASLSKKSDAYVYFVTHAAQFLRDGGRLGYIVPTKWMTTEYGRSFQTFLFDHFEIQAVVGFGARAFEDALVDTALLLLERCEDADERADTVTRFIRLKESMPVEHIVETILDDEPIPSGDDMLVRTRTNYRTVAIRQSDLEAIESGKVGHFLTAPQAIIRLVEHPALVPLSEVADVAYGNKTGANAFFFLDADDLTAWPIDERFLTPAIKSIRDTETQDVTAETTDRFLLDVRSYVDRVARASTSTAGSTLTDSVKRALARDGYDVLAAYVDAGERAGYHERATCAARDVWFDLGALKTPEILHPKFFNDRIVPLWNRDRLAPSNAVDGLYLDDGVDDEVVMGILNSTVHKTILECWGRTEGGGALQLMTYEMESLPIVDPALIRADRRDAFTRAVRRLVDGEEGAQDEVDEIVLDVLGVDISVEHLQEMQETIARRRIRSGAEAEAVVERLDAFDEVGTHSFTTSPRADEPTTHDVRRPNRE